MKVRNLLLTAGALVAFAAAPALAQDIEAQKGYKCKDKYLEANWMMILYSGSKPSYCEASIDKSGKIGLSACYEKKRDKLVGSLSGSLSIGKRCAISGTVTIKPTSGKAGKVEAEFYMDAAATSFAGVLSDDEGDFVVVQAIRMK